MDHASDPALRLQKDHYFNAGGLMVFTERFHLKRGTCCGNRCLHCPYDPKAVKGNRKVDPHIQALQEA